MRALKRSDSGGMTYKRQVISNAPANHISVFFRKAGRPSDNFLNSKILLRNETLHVLNLTYKNKSPYGVMLILRRTTWPVLIIRVRVVFLFTINFTFRTCLTFYTQ